MWGNQDVSRPATGKVVGDQKSSGYQIYFNKGAGLDFGKPVKVDRSRIVNGRAFKDISFDLDGSPDQVASSINEIMIPFGYKRRARTDQKHDLHIMYEKKGGQPIETIYKKTVSEGFNVSSELRIRWYEE